MEAMPFGQLHTWFMGSTLFSGMLRRIALGLLSVAFATAVQAQCAIGAFAGAAQDFLWHTDLSLFGVQFEFRSKMVPNAAVRASAWFTPERGSYDEVYRSVPQPEEYRWLAQTTKERHRMVALALDLRIPFEHNACMGGYYKGSYLVAGIGLARRWQTFDVWRQDRYGQVSTFQAGNPYFEPAVRAGVGGELNYRWGGIFLEGLVTTSFHGGEVGLVRFPGTLFVNVGYRYSFGAPQTGSVPEHQGH